MRCGYGKCTQESVFIVRTGQDFLSNVSLVYCTHHLGYALKNLMSLSRVYRREVEMLPDRRQHEARRSD